MLKPDYRGGSIVNLMSSIIRGLSGRARYPSLRLLPERQIAGFKNIVLFVIDGLGFRSLQKSRAITLQSGLRGNITSVFPSTTSAAVTTFLTGTAPQQHGLTGWFILLKELGAVTAVLPFRRRGSTLSLTKTSEVPIDTKGLFGHETVFESIKADSYIVTSKDIADSDFNLVFTAKKRRLAYGSMEEMFSKTVQAVKIPASRKKYIYAYWGEFDHESHRHGPGSREAASSLLRLDKGFSRFLRRISGTDTAVIVTADHGQIGTDRARTLKLSDHPKLEECLALPLCGERRIAYCYVRPSRARQFESYVKKHLARYCHLVSGADLIKQNYFGLYRPHPSLFDRVGDYALIMKENYAIQDMIFGEEKSMHHGVHGGVSEEEMLVPLIFFNP